MYRRILSVPAHQIRVGDKILPPNGFSNRWDTHEVIEANWDPADHTYYILWGEFGKDAKFFSPSETVDFVLNGV